MKAWYSKVRDTELKDGSVRATYVVTFETDNAELKREVEKYLQGIMDKTENNSEKPNNCEPQYDIDKGTIKCDNCAENGSYKCFKCDGEMYFKRLAYERGVKHAWEVAQKVFNSTVTFYEAEDVAKQIDKDINVRSKTEPQTDCAWK